MEVVQKLFDAVFQVVVFSAIPFIWWLVTARKKENFFSWIGFKRVGGNYGLIALVVVLFCAISIASQKFLVPHLLPAGATVQQAYAGEGASAILPILIFGMIQTGLSEEILFRGFLLKRLSAKFGYNIANIVQATIFGLIHGIMFFFLTTPFKALIIVIISGLPGWIFGYLNERKCGGSIIPSYLCHGLGNCIIALMMAFGILI